MTSNFRCRASKMTVAVLGCALVLYLGVPSGVAAALPIPGELSQLSGLLGFGEEKSNTGECNTYLVEALPDASGQLVTRAYVDGVEVALDTLPSDIIDTLQPSDPGEFCASGWCECTVVVAEGWYLGSIFGGGVWYLHCEACCQQPGQAPYCICQQEPIVVAACGCDDP